MTKVYAVLDWESDRTAIVEIDEVVASDSCCRLFATLAGAEAHVHKLYNDEDEVEWFPRGDDFDPDEWSSESWPSNESCGIGFIYQGCYQVEIFEKELHD